MPEAVFQITQIFNWSIVLGNLFLQVGWHGAVQPSHRLDTHTYQAHSGRRNKKKNLTRIDLLGNCTTLYWKRRVVDIYMEMSFQILVLYFVTSLFSALNMNGLWVESIKNLSSHDSLCWCLKETIRLSERYIWLETCSFSLGSYTHIALCSITNTHKLTTYLFAFVLTTCSENSIVSHANLILLLTSF
jgi:hypothetical protein